MNELFNAFSRNFTAALITLSGTLEAAFEEDVDDHGRDERPAPTVPKLNLDVPRSKRNEERNVKGRRRSFARVDGKTKSRSAQELKGTGKADVERAYNKMNALGLTKNQVDDLRLVFSKVDFDDSGEIDTDEFLGYFDIPATSFASTIFDLFDTDSSGGIDFYEFCIGIYNFLSLDAKGGARSIAKFSFTLYDRDHSGELDIDELECMVREMQNNDGVDPKAVRTRARKLMERMDIDDSGLIDMKEFVHFAIENDEVLVPVITLQQKLRRKVFGCKFWEELSRGRGERLGKLQNLEKGHFADHALSVCVNPEKCPLHRGVYNERRASITAAKKKKDAFAVLLAADTTAADFMKSEARKLTRDDEEPGERKKSKGRRKSVSGPLPNRMTASKYKRQSVESTKKLAQANSDAELAAAMRRVRAVRAHQRRVHQVLRVETGKVGLRDPRLAMRKADPNYIESPTSPTTPNTAWHKKLMSRQGQSQGHKSSKAAEVTMPAAVNTSKRSSLVGRAVRSSFASDDFEPVTPTSPPPKGFIVHARRKESARAKHYMVS